MLFLLGYTLRPSWVAAVKKKTCTLTHTCSELGRTSCHMTSTEPTLKSEKSQSNSNDPFKRGKSNTTGSPVAEEKKSLLLWVCVWKAAACRQVALITDGSTRLDRGQRPLEVHLSSQGFSLSLVIAVCARQVHTCVPQNVLCAFYIISQHARCFSFIIISLALSKASGHLTLKLHRLNLRVIHSNVLGVKKKKIVTTFWGLRPQWRD